MPTMTMPTMTMIKPTLDLGPHDVNNSEAYAGARSDDNINGDDDQTDADKR